MTASAPHAWNGHCNVALDPWRPDENGGWCSATTCHGAFDAANPFRNQVAWAESLVTSVERALPELEDRHRKDLRQHLAKALSVYGGSRVAAEFADQIGLPAGEPQSNGQHTNGHV